MISFKQAGKTEYKYISTLVGKAWLKDLTKGFNVAPLTSKVEGTTDKYELSKVYPFILDGEMARLSFGPNKAHDAAKNNNSHWVFLEIREDKLEEYTALLGKIGQSLEMDEPAK